MNMLGAFLVGMLIVIIATPKLSGQWVAEFRAAAGYSCTLQEQER